MAQPVANKPTMKSREHVYSMLEEIVGRRMKDVEEQRRADFAADRESRKSEMAEMIAAMGSVASQTKGREQDAGLRFGRYLRCLATTRGDTSKAADYCKQKLGDAAVAKYLGETTFGAGGALVPPEFALEIIPALRAKSVVRRLGARILPMNRNSLTVPFISTGAQASYVGEGTNITKSDASTGQLTLTAKKLAVISPVSNDLLRDTSPLTDTVVRDDVVNAMGEREDLAFIRDDGTQNKPKGMRYWAVSGHIVDETNTAGTANGATTAEITANLGSAIRKLMDAKVPMSAAAWVMCPRNWQRFITERTTTGDLIWKPEIDSGKFMGYPFDISQQIPTNLASPIANSTEIYFASFAELVIGQSEEIEVTGFDGGTYHDGSALVSGVSRDETVIRAMARHDFGDRYRGNSIVVYKNSWGPV